MKTVIAIRPEPGLTATIEAGRALGISVAGFALSEVEPVSWELPDIDQFDGLLIGSANVFRYGGEKLAGLRHLPILAVGEATANAAVEQGFSVEKVGEGGLQALLEGLDGRQRRLLRLSGDAYVPLSPPDNIKIASQTCYRLVYRELPDTLCKLQNNQWLVLLHSAGSAAHFASECDRLSLDRGEISLAALGPRILAAAGEGWCRAEAATQPNDTALLALAKDMCH